MKPKKKLFKVRIGFVDSEQSDSWNWRSENVVACTAPEAMKRVKLKTNKSGTEYYAACELLEEIDKP